MHIKTTDQKFKFKWHKKTERNAENSLHMMDWIAHSEMWKEGI